MDKITLSLLTEFSGEFGIDDETEPERFEQFAAWLVVRRHFTESTFLPSDLHTGGPNDTGIDAIGVIVNNNLVTDVDSVEELLEQNGFLDVTFVFIQAERSSHFDGAKIGNFGYGVRDFFGETQLPRNEAIKGYDEIMSAIYARAGKFKPGNPACHMYYVTTGSWQEDNNLTGRISTETSLLEDTNLFNNVEFVPVGAVEIQRLLSCP